MAAAAVGMLVTLEGAAGRKEVMLKADGWGKTREQVISYLATETAYKEVFPTSAERKGLRVTVIKEAVAGAAGGAGVAAAAAAAETELAGKRVIGDAEIVTAASGARQVCLRITSIAGAAGVKPGKAKSEKTLTVANEAGAWTMGMGVGGGGVIVCVTPTMSTTHRFPIQSPLSQPGVAVHGPPMCLSTPLVPRLLLAACCCEPCLPPFPCLMRTPSLGFYKHAVATTGSGSTGRLERPSGSRPWLLRGLRSLWQSIG